MATDNDQIRELIEHWAQAVRSGDLHGVLKDHAEDIVMFDVPPPYRGARGLDEYAATWPQFLTYIATGATFDIHALDITAGDTVAYANALLRCGTPAGLSERPEFFLRLTLGLRKEDGRWIVAHEHHSFPDDRHTRREESESEVRELHQRWFAATSKKDLDELMRPIAQDVVSYEHEAPLEYVGRDLVREVCAAGLASSEGAVAWSVPDLTLVVRDDVAVGWGLNRVTAQLDDGTEVETWSRGTRVFEKTEQVWTLIHQHVSFPFDPVTGRAVLDLTPR